MQLWVLSHYQGHSRIDRLQAVTTDPTGWLWPHEWRAIPGETLTEHGLCGSSWYAPCRARPNRVEGVASAVDQELDEIGANRLTRGVYEMRCSGARQRGMGGSHADMKTLRNLRVGWPALMKREVERDQKILGLQHERIIAENSGFMNREFLY